MSDWLTKEVDSVLEHTISALIKAGETIAPKSTSNSESNFFENYRDVALDGLKRGATKDNIAEVLKLGRNLKIPWLKGRWGKTLDKWAGRAAPVIQVAMAAIEIGLAHHDEQRDNQLALDRAMQRNQWVDEVCAQIQSGLVLSIDEVLDRTFDELLKPLQQKKNELVDLDNELERDILAWDALARKVQSVRF